MIMEYIVKRPFASLQHSGMEEKGNRVKIPVQIGKQLEQKGLVQKAYKTKEDKDAVKFRIEHAGGPWFRVMQGKKEIDKLHKSEAKELADKLNEQS